MLYRFGSFELDASMFELRREGQAVGIDARALDLLLYLIEHRDRIVPRGELLSAVWADAVVQDQSITQAAYMVRRALEDDPKVPRFVATLRGRGLRFIGAVSVDRDETPPTVHAASAGHGSPFVGRAEAVGRLGEVLEAARAGIGHVVLLAGEPGIGKTRLAEEFAARIDQGGAVVRFGRCPEVAKTPPYWPWLQLLRAGARGEEPELLEALGAAAPELAAIAPDLFDLREAPALHAGADSSAARFRVVDAFSRYWIRLADRQPEPMVLVIDDMHRADESSWDLLGHVARELGRSRLAIVACHRDAELHGDARRGAALAQLLREASTERIGLEGLSHRDIREFLERSGAADASDTRAREILDRTGGNPFFVSQLLGAAEGRLVPTLREAIIRQLDGLPREVRLVLSHASVIGREFPARLLDAISPSNAGPAALRIAHDAGLLQSAPDRPGFHRFHHVLVRDALYDGLDPEARLSLHARATEALASRAVGRPDLHAEVARHAIEAVPKVSPSQAIEFTLRAGSTAADALDFDAAVQHFEQALAVAEAGGATETIFCEILMSLGEAQTRAGSRAEGWETLQRAAGLARSLGASERLARVALAVAPGFFSIEVGVCDPDVVDLLEESLRLLPEEPSTLRARLLARLAMISYWSGDACRRQEMIDAAGEMADRLGDAPTSRFVAAARVVAEWVPYDLDGRKQAIDRLIVQGTGSEQLELSLVGRVFRITTALEEARIDDLERDVDGLRALVAHHPVASAGWYPDLYRAMLAFGRGDLREAEAAAASFLQIGQRTLDANVEHSYAAHVAMLGLLSGKAELFVEAAMDMSRRYPAVPAWKLTSAFIAQHAGRDREACEVLMEFAERGFENLPRDVFWVITLYLAGHLAAELKRRDVAEMVLPLLEPFEQRFCVAGFGSLSLGSAARVLGKVATLLERYDAAAGFLATAESVETQAGFHTWLAHTHFEQARLFVARGDEGDAERADERLARASSLSRAIGLVALGNEIDGVVRKRRT